MPPPLDLADIAAGQGGFVIYGEDAWDNAGLSVASPREFIASQLSNQAKCPV